MKLKNKKSHRICDYESYYNNPFLDEIVHQSKTNVVVSNSSAIVKMKHEKNTLYFNERKNLTAEIFKKLFKDKIKSLNLSNGAVAMFYYLKENSYENRAYLKYSDFKEKTGYTSSDSIQRSLTELLDRGLIARSSWSNMQYHLNPTFFGEIQRIVIMTEYIIRKEPEEQLIEDNNQLRLF